jgi:hypothetical protein
VKLDDVRAIMDERDAFGNSAFAPVDDFLKPVEALWHFLILRPRTPLAQCHPNVLFPKSRCLYLFGDKFR